MNVLNDEERAQLKWQHKRERDRRICDRIKAVLLYDKGWPLKAIAEALLLTEEAIRLHINEYTTCKNLKPGGGGSVEKLSGRQSQQLEEHLQKHTYLFIRDIVAYVQSMWGVTYTVDGLRSWLHRHRFSYKKPALVPGKANAEHQKEWIAEYEKLKQSLAVDETICFIDGVHPTHNTQPAYGWIKKGERKEISANSGRTRLNLSGVIDMKTHQVFVQEDLTLNSESTLRFLETIEQAYPLHRTIHLFCDNAPYYRNKAVRRYLERSKIKLHFLPPYSPNLNPIERLWKWMKERIIYNTYYREFEDFKTAILSFFKIVEGLDRESTLGQCLRSRVRDRFKPLSAPLANF